MHAEHGDDEWGNLMMPDLPARPFSPRMNRAVCRRLLAAAQTAGGGLTRNQSAYMAGRNSSVSTVPMVIPPIST